MLVEEYVLNVNTKHLIYAYSAHWAIILKISYVFSANQTAYNAVSLHRTAQHVHWGISCKQLNACHASLTA